MIRTRGEECLALDASHRVAAADYTDAWHWVLPDLRVLASEELRDLGVRFLSNHLAYWTA